jgi:hypothetical protein
MKIPQLRQIIKEEIQSVMKEEENSGLITFEQLKQACIEYLKDFMDDFNEDSDEDSFESAKDLDDLLNMLDEMGFEENEAYEIIFRAILK